MNLRSFITRSQSAQLVIPTAAVVLVSRKTSGRSKPNCITRLSTQCKDVSSTGGGSGGRCLNRKEKNIRRYQYSREVQEEKMEEGKRITGAGVQHLDEYCCLSQIVYEM